MAHAPDVTFSTSRSGSESPRRLPRAGAVKVDGVAISRDAIARETQNHPATKATEAWKAAARALIVRELLLQEARRRNVHAVPATDAEGRHETDDEATIRALVDAAVTTPAAGEDECRRVYDANANRFRSSDLYEVRHILLAAAPNDTEARSEAVQRAELIIDGLKQDPARFADLAALQSKCPSAATGGSLGQISSGQTVPEFERSIAETPIGVPSMVESRYGVHVVIVDRRIPGSLLPFDLVRPQIAEWLVAKSRHIGIGAFIADLARVAKIEGLDFELVPR